MSTLIENEASTAKTNEKDGTRVAEDGGLTIHSRRTERQRRKHQRKLLRKSSDPRTLFDLPYELIVNILSLLRPGDVFRLSRTCTSLHDFITQEGDVLAKRIIAWRYPSLSRCFRVPVLLSDVDPSLHPFLLSDDRPEIRLTRERPYQHVRSPDPALICTCLTCMMRWNSLCLAVDFAHWQDFLDLGEPLPVIARGRAPAWNAELLDRQTGVVIKALRSPLWHARILELHLNSTTRAIRRHAQNKGNRRPRSDAACGRGGGDGRVSGASGPPTVDFPFHRDNYYMLEAFIPGRGWNAEERRWMYLPEDQHATDVLIVERWVKWRRAMAAEQRAREEQQESSEKGAHAGKES